MITITGASGKTGSRVADALLGKKLKVRVVGRSADHLKQWADKGAEVAAGDQSDPGFLTKAFANADAAYLIIPPKYDYPQDYRTYYNLMGDAAVTAIEKSGLKKVVFLSSLGAERNEGTGPVLGLHDVEAKLNALKSIDLVIIRAGSFMENMLMNLDGILNGKVIADSIDPNVPVAMVASRDIGDKAAEFLLENRFRGHNVVELFGESLTYKDATALIGKALDIADLHYVKANDNDAIGAMVGMGISRTVAESFIEMSKGIGSGKLAIRKITPDKPNAPTRFSQFVEEVLKPAFHSLAVKRAA